MMKMEDSPFRIVAEVNAPLAIAAIGLFYLGVLAIYRLYFHPLAKFPGPRWAAITEYWELYQECFRGESGRLFIELDVLHEKYGPIVRIRPNEIHVKDSHWMNVLYTGPSDPRDRDAWFLRAAGIPLSTVGTKTHELHWLRKSAVAPFFSAKSVQKMEQQIQNYAEMVADDLENRTEDVLDLRVYFTAWATDFITDIIFHDSTRLFWDREKATSWFEVIANFSSSLPMMRHLPGLTSMGINLPIWVWKIISPPIVPYVTIYNASEDEIKNIERAEKAAIRYQEYIQSDSKTSKDIDLDDKDIFETILFSNLPPEEKLPKRIAQEVFNILMAGSSTTSKTASIAVFHVLDNPNIHRQLRDELIAAMPNKKQLPSLKDLQKLPLLAAIIKETMRIGCVAAIRFPMVSRHKALQYKDQMLPAGASISMTYCKAALDPEIFAEPNVFRPSRWLDGSQQPSDYERFVQLFGRGTRQCLGQSLAYAHLYAILASIFRCIDLELFETIRERDIDAIRATPLGEPTKATKGIRVKVKGIVP